MGLIASLGERAKLDRIPGFKFVANVAEGVLDGALLMAGPPGWAVLGAKAIAYAAVDPDVGIGKAAFETGFGAAVSIFGGRLLGPLLSKLGGTLATETGKNLAGRVAGHSLIAPAAAFTGKALTTVDDIATRAAGKLAGGADQVLARTLGTKWTNATASTGSLGKAGNYVTEHVGEATAKAEAYGQLKAMLLKRGSKFVLGQANNTVNALNGSPGSNVARAVPGVDVSPL